MTFQEVFAPKPSTGLAKACFLKSSPSVQLTKLWTAILLLLIRVCLGTVKVALQERLE
jgi:hypothetical protein